MAFIEMDFASGGGGVQGGYTKTFMGGYSTSVSSKKTLSFSEIGFEPQALIHARFTGNSSAIYAALAYVDLDNDVRVDAYGKSTEVPTDHTQYTFAEKSSDSITFWQTAGTTAVNSFWIFLGN